MKEKKRLFIYSGIPGREIGTLKDVGTSIKYLS